MSTLSMMQSNYTPKSGWKRSAILEAEKAALRRRLPLSLSYKIAVIDGEERDCAIISTDNLEKKTICSMPGEDLPLGRYVEWQDCHWLIIEKDFDNEVYTRGKMEQCNYLLRWISDGQIIERWAIVYDGTKYLTGEYTDRDYVVTRGDTRITLTLPKDEETAKLNRESRFLIDDYDTDDVLAYRLTKPLRIGDVYNGAGVYNFVLQEVGVEDDDNLELHIADYYRWFPREGQNEPDPGPVVPGATQNSNGRTVWF